MNKISSRELDVTAVVCAWNTARSIKKCLLSLHENNVREIILVDADSNDGTREIAKNLADKIYTDPRQGLAVARNIGLENAKCKYFLSVGADNMLPSGTVRAMVDELEKGVYCGVGCTTILEETNGYLSWALDKYKKARYFPGERQVIGTPHMYKTDFLRKYRFNPKMSWSDDGDLCDRLMADGFKLVIIDKPAIEISQSNLNDIIKRWKMYGKSDWETFRKYKQIWSVKRKISSILYPLRKEFLEPLLKVGNIFDIIRIVPFLILITMTRYFGWLWFTFAKKHP